MSDLKPWDERASYRPPGITTRGLLGIPDEEDGPSPADVPDIPAVVVCAAQYGRVRCYKIEGHAGTHAGMSKLEWG